MRKIRISSCAPVSVGASAYSNTVDFDAIKTAVLECERLGYDSFWVPDHLMLGRGNIVFECWTLLSALASLTERIRLGPLVLCNTHRHPSMVAKMAATLDVISKGRLTLGIGAGWYKDEQISYGLPWDDSDVVRIRKMEEAIEVIKRMWTGDKASFEGKYYQVREAVCEPRPLQKPHPPIWIGGGGERYLLPAVAKYADGWNIPVVPLESYVHKLEVLKEKCLDVGRDYTKIEKSIESRIFISRRREEINQVIDWLRSVHAGILRDVPSTLLPRVKMKKLYIIGSPEECAQKIGEYSNAGAEHFTLYFLDFPSLNSIRALAEEVVPSL